MRTSYPAVKKPLESRFATQHFLLLIIDVKDIELTTAVGEASAPCTKQAPQHWRAKWIEEEGDAWTRWKWKLDGIATEDSHRCLRSSFSAPPRFVFASDASERGVNFNAGNREEGIRCRQQHGPAHARAHINKGVRVDGRNWAATAPTYDHALEN
jgi:hypothetical protein